MHQWRLAFDVAPEEQPPAIAPSAPADFVAAVPATASSSSLAVSPLYRHHQQQSQLRSHEPVELVALKLIRHDEARRESAKLYSLGVALGNGSFGEVFAGTRKADNRAVAIKRLRKMANNGFNEILAEAVILDRIRGHPHVVQLLDVFELGTQMHFVFEDGGHSLSEMLRSRPSLAQIRTVAVHIQDALAFVHSIGLLHADLKPANVVVVAVDQTWTCRLADFGNALEASCCCSMYVTNQ